MANWLVIALTVINVVFIMVLVGLVLAQIKLKRQLAGLVETLEANKNDVAGLCKAAVKVDHRIEHTDAQIGELLIKLSEQQFVDQSSHPYGGVIQKVRSGASVNELMQNSGLSQDEAALLIRLHGAGQQR
ncbi:MAG: DUF2802 domain-containing protein [Methylococcaceae bacterium]|jgi:hypothetical protein